MLALTAKILFNVGFAAVWMVMLWIVHRREAHRWWNWPVLAGMQVCIFGVLALPFTLTRRFVLMDMLSHAIFWHLPVLAIAIAVLTWRKQRRVALAALGTAGVILGLWIYAFRFEPYNLTLRHYEIRTSKVTERMRIAVLADIQTDAPGDYDRQALARILSEKPDLILFAGDYIQHRKWSRYTAEIQTLNGILRESDLDVPLGAFAVRGNTDWEPNWREIFANTPVRVLVGERVELANAVVVDGLSMQKSFNRAIALEATEAFHIVVGHSPNFALADSDADLLIAGHTHGGQVALPGIGPLVKGTVVPREWASGHTEIEPDRHLVVSAGIGMERGNAPRLRFLCPPEIVIIDVLP